MCKLDAWEDLRMNNRQELLDEARALCARVQTELTTTKFRKEVERFSLREADKNLAIAQKHLMEYLQIEKEKS